MSAFLRVKDDKGRVYDIPALRGYSAYNIAVRHGFEGTEKEWLDSIMGIPGYSAYEVAKQQGYDGSEDEWLKSLVGPQGETGPRGQQGIQGETGPRGQQGIQGTPGISAYEVAKKQGFDGSEDEWLASLKGPKGDTPGVLTEEWTFTLSTGATVIKKVVTN